MQRTRESFPFSCAVTTKRSSRETAGSAKESILFRNTIGDRLSYSHSKRGSRFCSRWPRVKWGNLRVTARARSQSARHADPRGMERIQMPSIILDEYTIYMNVVNICAIKFLRYFCHSRVVANRETLFLFWRKKFAMREHEPYCGTTSYSLF